MDMHCVGVCLVLLFFLSLALLLCDTDVSVPYILLTIQETVPCCNCIAAKANT